MFLSLKTTVIAKFSGMMRVVAVKTAPSSRWPAVPLGMVAIFGLLVACDGVGVLKTNDPAKKLNHARLLLGDDRPLLAERLIGESMEIYESRGDRDGLAGAQYAYAWFLAGDAVETMADWYQEHGFRDSSADFNSRRQEAVKYFQLAATGFVQSGNFADAANVYFDLGVAQSRNGNREPACHAFSESLKNFYSYLRWDPAPEFRIPKGAATYEEYVIEPAVAAGCPVVEGGTNPSEDIAGNRHGRKLALADEAFVLARNILGSNHPAISEVSKFREEVIELYVHETLNQAYEAQEARQNEKAIALAEQAVLRAKRSLGENHPTTLLSMESLARRYSAQQMHDDAETVRLQALEIREVSDPDSPETLRALNDLARMYRYQGRKAEAEAAYLEAAQHRRDTLDEDHPDTLESTGELGYMYLEQSRFEEAEPILLKTFELRKSALGVQHPDTLRSMDDLATLLRRKGRYKEAETVYLELIERSVDRLGKKDVDTILRNNELASLYQDQGRIEEASELRERSLAWQRMDFSKQPD